MNEAENAVRSISERVNDLPRILEVMGRAVREALLEHKRAGNPIAAWQDGRVVWIQPEDIPVAEESEPASTR